MKLSKKTATGIIMVSLCLALIGVISATMLSGIYARKSAEKEENAKKVAEYSQQVQTLEAKKANLENDIAVLNEKYSIHLQNLAASNEDFYNLVKRFEALNERYRFYAGLSRVSGEGITVFLDDGESIDGTVTSFMVVHDTTLNNIVNALRSAGAQAISINGERVVSMTDIVCVGPSIRVNGRKMFAPFEIKAIGNAEQLYTSFLSDSVYASIASSELKYDVQMDANLFIPGYSGAYEKDIDLLIK